MSKYLFKNFEYILNNIQDPRYFYEFRNNTHVIGLHITIDDSPIIILALMDAMQSNKILSLLSKDDYNWVGTSIIFKNKNHAAMFYMYK